MSTNTTNTNSNNSSEEIPPANNTADDKSHNNFAPATSAKTLVGTLVASKYQLLDLLGTGGMSSVYKAQNLLTRKIVAVKLMHTRLLSDEQSLRRFQQEAIAACRLNHPNTINVHDMGIENDQPYMIMDYLEGNSLADIIKKQGKLDIDRCLNIFIQISNALADAHSRGVIHRDLKPSNIMLVKHNDNADFVKIVDFGIAKIIAEGTESMKLTNTGEVFGSPPYMSPEQGMGKKLDARSDIYSMGCMMYEALTGQPPFIGNNAMETILKHLNDPIPSLGGIAGDIRLIKQLDTIISKCLDKEPSKRYQTMNELEADLSRASLSTQSAFLARLGWSYSRLTKKILQTLHRARLAIVIFALISIVGLLILGAAFVFTPSSSGNTIADRELPLKPILDPSITPPNPETGEALWKKIESPANRDPNTLEYALKKFIHLAELDKSSGSYDLAGLWYLKAEMIIGFLELNSSDLSAKIHNSLAESCLLSNALTGPPNSVQKEQLALRIKKYGKFINPEILRREGLSYAKNAAIARESSLGTLQIMKEQGRLDGPEALIAYGLLAESFLELGDYDEAKRNFDHFRQMTLDNNLSIVLDKSEELSKSQTAFVLSSAGRFYLREKELVKCQDLLIRAYSYLTFLGKPGQYNLAVISNDLGLAREITGRYRDAEVFFNQAYSLLLPTKNQQAIRFVLHNLSVAAYKANDHKVALQAAVKSIGF